MHVRTVAAALTALVGGASALALPGTAQAADRAPARTASASAVGGPVMIAHRGASGQAPENTLAAVDAAKRMGVVWVENDVQRTKDGELVVVHDDNLARTTNVEQVFPGRAPWKIKDFTAAEIRRLDAGSWFGPAHRGARVPTLKQYVDRVEKHRQKLLLEIKNPALYPGIEKDIVAVLRKEGWLDRAHVHSRLVVQSFSAPSLRAVHTLRPDVTTGFLGTPAVADLPKYAAYTDQINPQHGTISAAYVAAVHRLKGAHGKRLRVNTWTVDDAVNAKKVRGYGVDGIITNRPDVVRAALRG
ncbi:glycerophosphodiester phosphodiesterase [Streptomyces candidus]|uniref:Glycerophosphoryl diester phosphodiesterase n=1 Tax=Streptomyces candidus TaxID=67283 RepID=A0A7X0H9M3_9ACTN|nr:glycerophosphodiester phosphodiesterase family protein [Streptomyces candidus]MBB6433626.1 glycerophosphoryl diester phosphodiesterase [Streptomyces candidus]GHH35201.1 hydrolase [Streptomyces candidus]